MADPSEAAKVWFGVGQYTLLLPDCRSLKDKRQRLRSATARLVGDLGVSTAEVGMQDNWQRAIIGVAVAASSEHGIDRVLDRVVAILERDARVVVTDSAAIVDTHSAADGGVPPGWDLL